MSTKVHHPKHYFTQANIIQPSPARCPPPPRSIRRILSDLIAGESTKSDWKLPRESGEIAVKGVEIRWLPCAITALSQAG